MTTRILLAGMCLLLTTQAQDSSPAPTLDATAAANSAAAPTVEARRSTPTPAASPNTSAPTAWTAAPTLLSPSNTASSAAPTGEVPTVVPTPAPTVYTSPTRVPTPSPTPPPTFSASSYCERPYQWSNNPPCVELATQQDRESGVGAFYDEEGCGPEADSTSVVGCSFGGVGNCRVCVFHRDLYSTTVLDGADVPFVDCPCCVPELYEMGGDINCNFTSPAVPVPEPALTPSPTEASVRTPGPITPGERSTSNGTSTTLAPSVTPIPMEPCETGAGGDRTGNSTLCVDVASQADWENGIGTFHEEGCEGLGCNIAGNADCRQCVFDNTAYAASGGEAALVDCPCCVPITYKLRPQDSECVWPATPPPTTAPTTYEEFLERSGGSSRHPGGLTAATAPGAHLVIIAASMAVGVATACFDASIEIAGGGPSF